ncbi:hypothetical protein [Ralstonia sp. Ralssp110]|uniref:hypothetical protein n=1 Tax=Ralstonia sp. Ralssp110 TaxID=3243004 RepID=UPI0039B6B838
MYNVVTSRWWGGVEALWCQVDHQVAEDLDHLLIDLHVHDRENDLAILDRLAVSCRRIATAGRIEQGDSQVRGLQPFGRRRGTQVQLDVRHDVPGRQDAVGLQVGCQRIRRAIVLRECDAAPIVVGSAHRGLPVFVALVATNAWLPIRGRGIQRGRSPLHRFVPSYACVCGFCRRWRGHCDRLSKGEP